MTIEAPAPNSYCNNMLHEEDTEKSILLKIRFVFIYSVCKETAAHVEEIYLQ